MFSFVVSSVCRRQVTHARQDRLLDQQTSLISMLARCICQQGSHAPRVHSFCRSLRQCCVPPQI